MKCNWHWPQDSEKVRGLALEAQQCLEERQENKVCATQKLPEVFDPQHQVAGSNSDAGVSQAPIPTPGCPGKNINNLLTCMFHLCQINPERYCHKQTNK